MPAQNLWTIGHSTRPISEFLELLTLNKIRLLVDIRRLPGSRKFPHFNRDLLEESLRDAGMQYVHLAGLGGKRRQDRHSKNTVWRNTSFRAYADYMESPEFQESAQELMQLARRETTCIMCSEAVWWRCHRSLVADYFKSKGWNVVHILSKTKTELHPYTAPARVEDGRLTYGPAEASSGGSR